MKLRGLSKEEKAVIDREWHGVPVVDAKQPLRLFVSKEDIVSATRKDASCCALANCCKRSLGSEGVFFYKTRAYVHVPTSNEVQRFFLSSSAMQFVASFDKGESVKAQEVLLQPAPDSLKLDSKLEQDRWQKRRKRGETGHAKHDNALRGTRPKKVKPVLPVANNMVRSGTGKVSFTVGSATGKAAK